MDMTDPPVLAARRRWGLLLCGALCACAQYPVGTQSAAGSSDRFKLDAAYEAQALQEDAGAAGHRAVKLDPSDPEEPWVALGDSPDGNVQRYYSKIAEKAAETARERTAQRAAVEEAANKAADEVKARADEERKRVGVAPPDPDDSPELVAEKRKALLAAFDVQAAADVRAARQKVVDDARRAQRYVDAAKTEADLKTTIDSLNAAIDAIYSDGIARAIQKLNAEYELAGNTRRIAAEKQSGYEGPYYKLERVDRYFKENWAGGKEA
jgi:hypothetical protein